jgi:class 3 adenylate cyclase/tetratricopeptide (TPR) repeat protein
MECPSCHSETPDGSKFCISCGAALPARCPSCGSANPAGAKFCLECGQKLAAAQPKPPPTITSTAPPPSRSEGSAERRQLTVMFVDLVGSTALSARLDPEDMREIIGAYHRCCADQITKADGFVAKFMGDGVLAYFGYPLAHEDDAERAVRSALSLVEAVPTLRTSHNAVLQVRVGIATGLVVVGDLIGEGDAQERGVVGETPNLAARLQALAEPGQVVISQSTRRLAGGMFEYRDLGEVTLKGLSDAVQAWQVTGTSAVQSRFEAKQESSLTPLVGREEELELLLRRWQQAASGEGRVLLLSGEPGIGKSRLTVALQERLQAEPHTRLRYFCSPHHTDSAFYPVIAQLERAASFERRDTSETKLDKLVSLVGQPWSHDSDIQLLTELLSIPTGHRYAPLNVSPQRKKERTFEALLRQLEMVTRPRPALVVYEDVHWLDPSSRELLDMTVERVASLPVLLIVTFRPEFQAPWIGQAHVSTLTLSRLGRRESAALAERVAGNDALPDEIMAEIVERTDGVPLFVEEMTKAVLEVSQHGEAAARTLTTAPLSALAVPATLHASLMARLDRLGATSKEIAQIGAAIGREFSYELLTAVAQEKEEDVKTALWRLTDAGLVSCRGTAPHAMFLFKHALVRDAAYGSLLRSQRLKLHGSITAVLEVQFPEIVAAQPQVIAQHCVEAHLIDKAIAYLLKAGQKSLARSAMIEAVQQLKKGLELANQLPQNERRDEYELNLQIVLGKALMMTHGYGASAVRETLTRAREITERLNRPTLFAQVLWGEWLHQITRGEIGVALRAADQLIDLGVVEHDYAFRMNGLRMRGNTLVHLGHFAEARACLEQTLALFQPADRSRYAALIGLDDPQTNAMDYLSIALSMVGYTEQARALNEVAVAEAHRLSRPFPLAHALCYTWVNGWIMRRDYAALHQLADELTQLCQEQGFYFWRLLGTMFRGWCMTMMGQASEGIGLLEATFADYCAAGSVLSRGWLMQLLAEAYRKAGRVADALKQLTAADHMSAVTEERSFEAQTHRLRGELLSTQDLGVAENSFQTALKVARHQGAKLYELRASTSLARLWSDQGKRTEARDLLAPIYGWFTEGFDTPDLKEAKVLLEELS